MPDKTKPFTQTVDMEKGYMTSVSLQEPGNRMRPVAHFSSKLDMVATGLPICLRAVPAAEKAIMASRDLVDYQKLTPLIPHCSFHTAHSTLNVNYLHRTENCSSISSKVVKISFYVVGKAKYADKVLHQRERESESRRPAYFICDYMAAMSEV